MKTILDHDLPVTGPKWALMDLVFSVNINKLKTTVVTFLCIMLFHLKNLTPIQDKRNVFFDSAFDFYCFTKILR